MIRMRRQRYSTSAKSTFQNRSIEELPADEGAAQIEERLMQVRPPFVAHSQPPEPAQPGEGPLDLPPVPAQPLARLHPLARDPGQDVARPQRPPMPGGVVRLVAVQLLGALAGPSARAFDRLDPVDDRF